MIRETLSLSESSDSSDDEDEDVVEEKKGENIGVCDELRQSQEEVKCSQKREDVKRVMNPSPEKGRIIRKFTATAPVFAPKRKMPISLPEKTEAITKFLFKSTDTKGTQTASCGNNILKKRKIHRIVSSYIQDKRKIEETREEEEFVFGKYRKTNEKKWKFKNDDYRFVADSTYFDKYICIYVYV